MSKLSKADELDIICAPTHDDDKRLYDLLASEELDRDSYVYYGKYKLDINDVNRLRKYTNVIVCPTSRDFYVKASVVEEHATFQFMSSIPIIKAYEKYKELFIQHLDKNEDYTISKSGVVRLTQKGLIEYFVKTGKGIATDIQKLETLYSKHFLFCLKK